MGQGRWIDHLVSRFGEECRQTLGPAGAEIGEKEAGIRRAVENLLHGAARELGVSLRLHPEARRPDLGIRPDFAARLAGERQRVFGYVELKSPGKRDISPGGLRGDDRRQWEGIVRLPNVIYTNGQSWYFYRFGRQLGETVHLEGDIHRAGSRLRAPGRVGDDFERLLSRFFDWHPDPITSVNELVARIAPLCNYLRLQVHDRLQDEARPGERRNRDRPFTTLAQTWEHVLFPRTDERDPLVAFSDRYAQTVTFALLLAGADRISLSENSLHETGRLLGAEHTVMGRALQLLTDHVEEDFRNSLDMLVRLADGVDWDTLLAREPEAHVYLYEKFLEKYDSELRKESGTYYTPTSLVREMVRLVDEVLRRNLGCDDGFADPRVTILDPAMGTGTFLVEIIELVVARRSADGNEGFRGEAVEELAQRLIGFEKQMAAYAVAQMRISQSARVHEARITLRKLRLHLCDTLADPWKSASTLFGYSAPGMQPLLRDVEASNHVKRDERVTVVIGNPPDRERAHGEGGWIETRDMGRGRSLLDDFRLRGDNSQFENKLRNLYVYFWRWATFKVFEQHSPEHERGVVCFISTAGFLRGPGFRGMRSYLRKECSEGWIIDLSPEGRQPPVRTRLFPEVQRELAVAIFVRDGRKKPGGLAEVHYTAVSGERSEKEQRLTELTIGGEMWLRGHAEESDVFTPHPTSRWGTMPQVSALLPWGRMGFQAKRTWITCTDPDRLRDRWNRLVHEPDPEEKGRLFRNTEQWTVNSVKRRNLYGEHCAGKPLTQEVGDGPDPIQVLHRSFDRQWLIPDVRLLDRPAADLWRAFRPDQLYIVEQNRQPIKSGPGLVFSALVPDMHCFNNNGGRVYPLRHADGSPNIAPGFLEHLANSFGFPSVSIDDVAAYMAAVAAHPAFTMKFANELNSPGMRIPWTADRDLWNLAVETGRHIIWAATFGERYVDTEAGRPAGGTQLRRVTKPEVKYSVPVDPESLPGRLRWDAEGQALVVGDGVFLGVDERMRSYDVGGRRVLDAWLAARSGRPYGRTGSPLDRMRPDTWRPRWSVELAEILSVLRHLTTAEPAQALLLESVLEGPLIDVAELMRRKVLDPPRRTRAARPPLSGDLLPGMDRIETQEMPPVQPLKPAGDPAPAKTGRPRPSRRRKRDDIR